MYIGLRRHIKAICNVKNIFLKEENCVRGKKWSTIVHSDCKSVDTETYSPDHGLYFLNNSFVEVFPKSRNKITYEMRRDRGGTVRKKLSREKKKTQKKQKKENSSDVHK
ncbi:conserved Plasmodium protein, unknown function [Plasmodium ovale wallikeri]|uniref:Uncharacterized protein n=2 Tax=Plasmodium ovale TaxID=36330 RepID=A0A1A8YJJ6_PLAOA|nr:conserved Plasmodium protein, unknown function [Plasmodium ovale wallikeri]SBT31712.1 conserved Plasmodium protein, unknown function [Plasmodium ovale wallikeri]SBT75445.1 conserved Plasmodium protein, unknown function [Plasmodium ovale]